MTRRNFSVCDSAMHQIRQALAMPSAKANAWHAMDKARRVYLLMAAGISAGRQCDEWPQFSAAEQARIEQQIAEGARIARRWSTLCDEDNQ